MIPYFGFILWVIALFFVPRQLNRTIKKNSWVYSVIILVGSLLAGVIVFYVGAMQTRDDLVILSPNLPGYLAWIMYGVVQTFFYFKAKKK